MYQFVPVGGRLLRASRDGRPMGGGCRFVVEIDAGKARNCAELDKDSERPTGVSVQDWLVSDSCRAVGFLVRDVV